MIATRHGLRLDRAAGCWDPRHPLEAARCVHL